MMSLQTNLFRGVGRSSKVGGGQIGSNGGGAKLIKSRGGGANWPKVVFFFDSHAMQCESM